MRIRLLVHHLLSLLVSVSLLLTPAAPTAQAAPVPQAVSLRPEQIDTLQADTAQANSLRTNSGLFRTHIVIDSPARRARLDELGIVVLEETADRGEQTANGSDAVGGLWSAVVLADDEQLETLARLRYQPQASDEFVSLVESNTAENSWLAVGVAPLLAQSAALSAITPLPSAGEGPGVRAADARKVLRATARALTPEERTALADLTSLDDDADGLTNAQEAWWCTDPLNADSDGDGTSDGAEVQAAKDWLANRRAGPPSTGRPFAGWPPATFDPTHPPTCRDGDGDGVPDMAERWDLGLNMNAESTDRDKFDDGQELFGSTEWGRGALPRITDDAGYIFSEMPTWVKAPGNHPFVAAFPVASSLKVETVTTVTTDHVISSGTEKSYSTAKTEGTSTSVADTVTWNEWQEVSRTNENTRDSLGRTTRKAELVAEPITLGSIGATVATFVGAKCLVDGATEILTGDTRTTCERIYDNRNEIKESLIAGGKEAVYSFGYDPDADLLQNAWQLRKCALDVQLAPLHLSCLNKGIAKGAIEFYNDLRNRNAQNAIKNGDSDPGGSGTHIEVGPSEGGNSTVYAYPRYEISIPVYKPAFVPTETRTAGESRGGAITTTTEQYEEHTVTNGEAFSNGESWGNATAADSAHTADLRFTYKVRNTGTEYARQIGNLAFNLYIGDSPDPAYTYFVAPDLGGSGIFQNFMPAEEHTYTSRRIPLSLEQMKAIDLGGPLRVVVEDFTYGVDELFYQDAANAGVLVAMEDGSDDGNEAIDSYLLPTWGEESVVDVLARYFPHTADENGTVIAIWTPEYGRSDTPAWCADPKVVGIGGQRTLWCKHALATADWWNVYTNGLGDGSEGFQDTPAAPGAVALFRFNKDTDLDGYSDRSEQRMGTDPTDPGDFPRPELLAGLHSIRSGDFVTATLSLLNTGLYDAYGVEAVLIAPDDSVSITNNTVGGSGRVAAQKQVIVGSRIALQTPLPTAWTQAGHAAPAAGGYYTGGEDRTYTFIVSCGNAGGCTVSSDQLSVLWSDSKGVTGTLGYGASYASPTFLPVGGFGLTLALHSGTVANRESFTVDARTPRDTFQYTINREPYTEPLVIVSYNDPQGNHRFILPPTTASLTTPSDNLAAFSGQMLDDVGVEIVTTEEYTGGATSTRLLVNNPSETTLTDAHLFLEFINISGTVVSEVTTPVNLPPGPTTAEVAWDSTAFNPAYRADEDYIVMAFLTDYQGNILDTAGRPLSSFQDDPRPAAALDNGAQVWDFGTAQQGTLIEHPFALASVGYLDLLAYLGNAPGLSVDGPAATAISPGDVALYTVQLNTESLPVGAFEETIPVRTSDPQNPTASLTIRGTITPGPDVIWRTRAQMPTRRVGHGLAATTNGTILAIGGTDGGTQIAAVEEYNPTSDVWSVRTNLPSARERLGVASLPNGNVYAIGGCSSFTCATAYQTVEAYDLATNTWSSLADMPTARGNFGIAATGDGKIYAIAGSAGGGWLSTVEQYDSATNLWTTRPSLQIARYGLTAATGDNGKIYAFGGFNENGPLDTVEEYDPATNSWSIRSPMPTARGYLSAVIGNNSLIYVIGGSDGAGTEYATVEVYDPVTNAWTQATTMPTPRYGMCQ